ncbi:hypothetical protein HK098_007764 [Nowakowskiella sp. JEL0407]|nr:hypothetical protein HK098_007764 [Nowakowskiella sp. JEL0407]
MPSEDIVQITYIASLIQLELLEPIFVQKCVNDNIRSKRLCALQSFNFHIFNTIKLSHQTIYLSLIYIQRLISRASSTNSIPCDNVTSSPQLLSPVYDNTSIPMMMYPMEAPVLNRIAMLKNDYSPLTPRSTPKPTPMPTPQVPSFLHIPVGLKLSPRTLVTVSFMLANKFLDDQRYSNGTWARLSGINLTDLNAAEWECLAAMGYSLDVHPKEFEDWKLTVDAKVEFDRIIALDKLAASMRIENDSPPLSPPLSPPAITRISDLRQSEILNRKFVQPRRRSTETNPYQKPQVKCEHSRLAR